MTERINVRALVEFALEGGDITSDGQSLERMQEGMRGHKLIQGSYPPGHQWEVPVKLTVARGDLILTVQGRIDGLYTQGGIPTVEEIKTTRAEVHKMTSDEHPVHWAQAEVYAHMIAQENDYEAVNIKLLYMNPSGENRVTFSRLRTKAQLAAIFDDYLTPYINWLIARQNWLNVRNPSLKALRFPFSTYRAGQRELMQHAYYALKEGKKLLVQAPTGTGKTAATLFPALKAMGEGHLSFIFYLTARTTVRKAAESALELMRADGLIARSVTITARDKICACPGKKCDPEDCPRAKGYYDRRRAAMYDALKLSSLPKSAIEALAETYTLCPFELSLDLAETSDIIICDYNYVFDPRVYLRRFFMDKGDYGLLIDEAHNLDSRARDMLIAKAQQGDFAKLRTEIGKAEGRKHPLYKVLGQLLGAFKKHRETISAECATLEKPEELGDALENFTNCAQRYLGQPISYAAALFDQFFSALNFVRTLGGWGDNYCLLNQVTSKNVDVTLLCLDASAHIAACMKKVKGSVLFSATLSPMSYYRDLLGLSESEGDALLSMPSPFPPKNLLVLRMRVNTKYSVREQSFDQVAHAIASLASSHIGNYLACFPSHAYLAAVRRRFFELYPNMIILSQQSAMSDEERDDFLSNFVPSPTVSMVAFITMGGIFSEGIDLPGDRLSGAAIVGVGLPQVCIEREALRSYWDTNDGTGFESAYIYPGICKVLQASGRVIRTMTDRGVVLLLDDRYYYDKYAELLPPHWHVTNTTPKKIAAQIEEFWHNT